MHRRSSDTQGSLWGHAGGLGPLHGRNDVTHIVQTAEDTGDINALRMLYLVLQLTHIIGHRIHTQRIQTAIEHVCLDAHLVERFTECPNGSVWILTCQQVYLLEGTTIGLHTVEHAHVDNGWCDTLQLVFTRLELT